MPDKNNSDVFARFVLFLSGIGNIAGATRVKFNAEHG